MSEPDKTATPPESDTPRELEGFEFTPPEAEGFQTVDRTARAQLKAGVSRIIRGEVAVDSATRVELERLHELADTTPSTFHAGAEAAQKGAALYERAYGEWLASQREPSDRPATRRTYFDPMKVATSSSREARGALFSTGRWPTGETSPRRLRGEEFDVNKPLSLDEFNALRWAQQKQYISKSPHWER